MNKKVYIILGGIVVLIIIVGVVILVLMSKNKAPSSNIAQNQGVQNENGSNPNSNNGSNTNTTNQQNNNASNQSATGLSKINNEQTISPILSLQGGEVWYFNQAGSLEELNLSNANLKQFILPKTLQVSAAIWAMQGSDFIVITNNSDGTRTFNYYSSSKQSFTQYPSNVKAVQFTPSGNQVVYIWQKSDGTNELEIADPNLSNYKVLIAKLPGAVDTIAMNPLGSSVLVYNSATPSNGLLYYITLNNEQLQTIKTNVENAAVWSNDGQHFLYNNYNASNTSDATLWLGNASQLNASVSLGVATPVSKIGFNLNGSMLYYAVQSATSGTSDSIWSYNVSSGAKNQILNGSTLTTVNLSAKNIMASNDGSMLYFVNSNDGFIYSLPAVPKISASGGSNSSSNSGY